MPIINSILNLFQVISFLAYLKEQNLTKGTHAIVVPASTFENWANELTRWCPNLKVVNYSGSQEERKAFRLWWKNDKNKEEIATYDIILTTYNQIGSNKLDRAFYRTISLEYIIFDEAHMLKNMTTQRYASLMQIPAARRILLTGTPLQNNLIELMSLLIFVMPAMLGEMQQELTTLFKMANRSVYFIILLNSCKINFLLCSQILHYFLHGNNSLIFLKVIFSFELFLGLVTT